MPINSMPLCDKKLFPVDSTADSSMHKIVAADVVILLQTRHGVPPFAHKASPQIEDKQSQTCHPGLSRQAFLIFFFALPGCRVFAGIFFSSRREFFAGAAKLFSLFWLRAGTDRWGGTRF
jgi:hypothetical protein